jgi:hypothetical protein
MVRLLFILTIFLPLITGSQQSALTLPRCTDAQHARYSAVGPDGQRYATWHPQIDARAGCAFDHEHGSNPALFAPAALRGTSALGEWPLFGYSAGLMGMSEGHAGFKVYVFDDSEGRRWMLTQHQGTANAVLAACTRHHTLDAVVLQIATGTILARHYGMADFGVAAINETNQPLTPANCLEQANISTASGTRLFPAAWLNNIGYEPWRATNICDGVGFCPRAATFNTKNPQTACSDVSCSANVQRQDALGQARGTWRELTLNAGFGFPNVATLSTPLVCRPVDAQSYAYSCVVSANYDETPFRANPFVTGGN